MVYLVVSGCYYLQYLCDVKKAENIVIRRMAQGTKEQEKL